jgi:putative ABC transport system permease protein
MITDNTQLQDLNLLLEQVGETRDWKLSSTRVFMDDHIGETISTTFQDAKPYLTYFVNGIRHGSMETPYSFVTALDNPQYFQNPDDMVINQWLADDLRISIGDSLTLRYFVVGPLRELEEHQALFRISGILPMEEAGKDNMLMPHLPGLSDAGSCRDWETGVPIDLDKIRQKDQDYWDEYRGTPKAYISLRRGQELWQNRFGNLTMVVFPEEVYDEKEIRARLGRQLDPFRLEYQINPVREHGMEAARGGVDFSQLFAGLGIFIIVSGLLLTVLLLQYNLQRRQKQIQLFSALGFSKALVRKLIMTEAFMIIITGALVGMAVSTGYARLVFTGLNRIWHDIVRTDVLEMHISGENLLFGFLASVVLGSLVVYFGIGKIMNVEQGARNGKRKIRTIIFYTAIAFTLLFAIFSFYAIVYDPNGLFAWLLSGISMLISLLLWAYHLLQSFQKPATGIVSPNLLSWKNLVRNPTRSFTIVTLLALGSFVIIVTAANRKDLAIDPMDMSGGTGGFKYIAETTVPVLRNLNHPDSRAELVLPGHVNFVQFLSTHDDDASCFNLNRVANPRVLATHPDNLAGRFSFVSRHPWLDRDQPWLSLDMEYEGVVPAVADQSVMQWGLGKKVGDTLFYVNARGEEIRLLLIGGLKNSVLQGNVVISQRNFLKHFPATGGSNVFLLDHNGQDTEALQDELNFIFRDHGWELTSTADKLAGFNTVENTYLRIFFLLGAFGMLLGTVGLAIVLAKSMLERRNETAMFKALGFTARNILRLYFTEYAALFLLGLFAGAMPALVANMPSWFAGAQNVSHGFLFITMGAILLNGLVWILAIPAFSIRRIKVLKDIRD